MSDNDEMAAELGPEEYRRQPAAVRRRLSERWYALASARGAAEKCPLPVEDFCVTCGLMVDERLRAYMRAIRDAI